jgi:hypothetical protein
MSGSRLRGTAATLLIPGLVAVAVATAAPASAASPGIRKPTFSVVCSQPHHARMFTAASFRQRGLWAAGGHVTVTLSSGHARRAAATINATTDATGHFRINRILVARHTSPWRIGATYTWMTEISGDSWATARRGTVVLGGSC